MLLPRTLYVHQRYFCGPDAVKTERLQKREKKQKETNEKAMRTLRIKGKKPAEDFFPSPMGVYGELMEEAKRPSVPMYAKGSSADLATTALAKEAFASKDKCPPIPQTSKGKKRVKKEAGDSRRPFTA